MKEPLRTGQIYFHHSRTPFAIEIKGSISPHFQCGPPASLPLNTCNTQRRESTPETSPIMHAQSYIAGPIPHSYVPYIQNASPGHNMPPPVSSMTYQQPMYIHGNTPMYYRAYDPQSHRPPSTGSDREHRLSDGSTDDYVKSKVAVRNALC